jgi:hypothetical protein
MPGKDLPSRTTSPGDLSLATSTVAGNELADQRLVVISNRLALPAPGKEMAGGLASGLRAALS